ncbi:NAD dependent epimerase/dehydratase family protein [Nitzschia inconspicua]|uniref:NAD dependent epimerase/dehydratase family protein n=1 Tax=Nitzschia inconspicua TaxID=303405 RepID=A0A9K3K743_9STRA|nr:NAD dependent epimerase/dehydratase family protein [Nitzschia inconspicua]KAG7362281.1 NAD dependent epimerase/dehydratase family protein [Nitzschia inconspicua]
MKNRLLLTPILAWGLVLACPTLFTAAMAVPRECAVVGVGVLGSSLCQQLLDNDWKVIGITKTTNRHDDIMKQVGGDHGGKFSLELADDNLDKKYPYCVFCAPPSGFDDYPAAVEDAMTKLWDQESGGVFVFTSSGGIYGPGDSSGISTVNESSPLPDPSDNPRSARLMGAEDKVRAGGGTILRLAGLYTLDRGAHNFWMGKEEVGGRADGIINLLHYDDAAGSVVAALQVEDPTTIKGQTYLVSDGQPLTRQQICESTIKSDKYSGMKIPKFTGQDSDPMGKIYDGSATESALNWRPRYPSFDEFMAASKK